MQAPLQVSFREMPRSEALEDHIRQKAAKLEEFHSGITSCRVTVEQSGKHHQQGHVFTVHVKVHVPGKEIIANRDHHEDVYVALRDAFDAAKRQLEDTVREMRGQVKVHPVSQHGKVARLIANEGYGFIQTPDGRELYFSHDNVVHPGFDQLAPGADVQFLEDLAGDTPQAKRVSTGKHGATS